MPLKETFYFDVDLDKNSLVNAKIHPLSTTDRIAFGNTLTTSDVSIIVFDITLLSLFIWNGTAWQDASVSSFIKLSDTPSSYAGTGNSIVYVNPDETELSFLSLTSKTLVSPTITPSWTLLQNDGTSPYNPHFSNSKSLVVDVGVVANLSATYQYPTPSTGQVGPTTISGDFGTSIPGPNTPVMLTKTGIIANQTDSVTLSKPQSGLVVVNNQVQIPSGTDTTSDSISISFSLKVYYGTTTKDGSTQPILDTDVLAQASSFQSNRLKSLTNFGGGTTRILIGIPTAFGTATFIVDGLTNTAFTKVRSNSNFVNSAGYTYPLDIYVSNNIYNSALDSFQIT